MLVIGVSDSMAVHGAVEYFHSIWKYMLGSFLCIPKPRLPPPVYPEGLINAVSYGMSDAVENLNVGLLGTRQVLYT